MFWSVGNTVPHKSKLTLETRTSRLDPRASMLEMFEVRVSSLESQVLSIESRVSRNKAFSNMQKLERVSKKRILKYKCSASIAIASKHSSIRLQTKCDFFLRQLVFKTKCRPAVEYGNLPVHVNADNPLCSEPFAKFLK